MTPRRLSGLTLFLVLLGLAGAADRAGAMPLGYNDGFLQLQQAGFGGAQLARYPVASQPIDHATDAATQATLEAGVVPVLIPAGWSYGPETPQEYAALMGGLAERYGSTVIYQEWNEPNLATPPYSGGPTRPPFPPALAAEFATAGAQAIRAVSPDATILGPAIAPVRGWRAYFAEVYRYIPQDLGVQIALNIYPRGRHRMDKVRAAYRLADAYGEVAVTEFDLAPPWRDGRPASPQMQGRAVAVLRRLGATMVVLNGVGRFAPMLSEIERGH